MSGRPDPLSPAERRQVAGQLADRYAPLLDSGDAFREALLRPLPQILAVNELRIDAAALAHRLADAGLPAAPVDWCPAALKLPAGTRPGQHWGFMAGLFQIQEEAALLPVCLLDPQPGERVLDLCAAPGNKTAQIAVRMANRGTVIANDPRRARLAPLRQTIRRLGLVNVQLLVRDGQTLRLPDGVVFDRILVDAPCTCEGTFRKVAVPGLASAEERRRAAAVQLRLLRTAVQLLRPGGRLVYSTCTFAPEENECVVSALLDLERDKVRVRPVSLPGLRLTPGVTGWQGQRLEPALAGTVRLWPHHQDTGGFYAAVLERVADSDASEPQRESGGQPLSPSRRVDDPDWRRLFTGRFAIPDSLLDGLELVRWGKRHWRLVNRDTERLEGVQPESLGLPGIRIHSLPPKPTTAAVLLLGDHARRNVVELDATGRDLYRQRLDQPLDPARIADCTGPGHVIVRHAGCSLGMGQLIIDPNGSAMRLRSLYPAAWTPRAPS